MIQLNQDCCLLILDQLGLIDIDPLITTCHMFYHSFAFKCKSSNELLARWRRSHNRLVEVSLKMNQDMNKIAKKYQWIKSNNDPWYRYHCNGRHDDFDPRLGISVRGVRRKIQNDAHDQHWECTDEMFLFLVSAWGAIVKLDFVYSDLIKSDDNPSIFHQYLSMDVGGVRYHIDVNKMIQSMMNDDLMWKCALIICNDRESSAISRKTYSDDYKHRWLLNLKDFRFVDEIVNQKNVSMIKYDSNTLFGQKRSNRL